MCETGLLHRHAALANRMAERLGLDMAAQLRDGGVTAEEWRDVVTRCTCCSDIKGCHAWLAATEAPAPAAPDFCENRLVLAQLCEGGHTP